MNPTPAAQIRLRPIAELLEEEFFVPSYQRGYRWSPKQVTVLLDDLDAFLSTDPGRNSYYCLQPVVVCRREDGSWELVDGQQRLTTIYILLGCLADVARLLGKTPYRLRYETREGSAEYLEAPTAEGATKYVDYHHIYEAREAILGWFKKHDGAARVDLVKCLTQPDGRGANVRVIWYELGKDQVPKDVFLRLNVGRIPLTSAELIRALFLRADAAGGDDRRRQRISQDWDLIEKRLHDPRYWYFLQSETRDPPARIEYLFDIFVKVHNPELAGHPDELATFLAFQAWLQAWLESEDSDPYEAWLVFRNQTARTLEEWFEDRVLYHLVGALVAVAPEEERDATARVLVELLRAREGKTGTEFERFLRGRAWRRLLGRTNAALPGDRDELERNLDEHLENLVYRTGTGPVRTALLLFNVAGLLANEAPTQRFRFDGFKENSWDIEHIRSVTEYIPEAPPQQRNWLKHAKDFVDSPAARTRDQEAAALLSVSIDTLLADSAPGKELFGKVFEGVRSLSGEAASRESNNGLSNLALLDMGTNRSYQNAIFPVKRKRIIELDREGTYVPPGTRNVFLKYYSPQAAQLLLWDADDQADYGRAQRETLLSFFSPIVEQSDDG